MTYSTCLSRASDGTEEKSLPYSYTSIHSYAVFISANRNEFNTSNVLERCYNCYKLTGSSIKLYLYKAATLTRDVFTIGY